MVSSKIIVVTVVSLAYCASNTNAFWFWSKHQATVSPKDHLTTPAPSPEKPVLEVNRYIHPANGEVIEVTLPYNTVDLIIKYLHFETAIVEKKGSLKWKPATKEHVFLGRDSILLFMTPQAKKAYMFRAQVVPHPIKALEAVKSILKGSEKKDQEPQWIISVNASEPLDEKKRNC